jgi:hypothetical protein
VKSLFYIPKLKSDGSHLHIRMNRDIRYRNFSYRNAEREKKDFRCPGFTETLGSGIDGTSRGEYVINKKNPKILYRAFHKEGLF